MLGEFFRRNNETAVLFKKIIGSAPQGISVFDSLECESCNKPILIPKYFGVPFLKVLLCLMFQYLC